MNSKNNSLNSNELAMRSLIQKIANTHLSTGEVRRYFEGSLSKNDRLRIDLHIARCSVCNEKIELLTAYRDNGVGKPVRGISRQVRIRLAHAPVLVIKRETDSILQRLFAIKKKPRDISLMSPTKPKPERRHFVELSELVLSSNLFRDALAFEGGETDWSNPEYDQGLSYFYKYRIDGQGNLLINITVNDDGYDRVEIKVNNYLYEEKLAFNGLKWEAQKIIKASERKKLSESDSISIKPLRKK